MFPTWAKKVPEKFLDDDGIENKMWIIPAPIFVLPYINYTNCISGDSTLEAERLNEAKKNNVQFLQ